MKIDEKKSNSLLDAFGSAAAEVHLTQDDVTVLLAGLYFKKPESLEAARESLEKFMAVQVTDLTMFLADRIRFVKMIEERNFTEEARTEALPVFETFFIEKKMPTTFAAWQPAFHFTSEIPR
jgi:hypothetical protein